MGRWKRDATEFAVGVNYNEVRGAQSSIPKPVVDVLGHPDVVKFVIKGKRVELEAGEAKLRSDLHETNKFAGQGILVGVVVFGLANGYVTFYQYGHIAYVIANSIVVSIGGITGIMAFAQKFTDSLHYNKGFKWRLWGMTGILEILGLAALMYSVSLLPK